MTPGAKNIWVIWKGQKSGPFEEREVADKVNSGQIGRLYSVVLNGTETTAGEFVDSLVPSLPPKASKTVKIKPREVVESTQLIPIHVEKIQTPPIPTIVPENRTANPYAESKILPNLPVASPLVTVVSKGKTFGPFTFDELREQIALGAFTPDDLAWHEGLSTWVRLGDLPVPDSIRPPTAMPVLPPDSYLTQHGRAQAVQHFELTQKPKRPSSEILAGYILCIVSIFFFPPIIGLAAFILGIIVCAKGSAGHGVTIIMLSIICAIAGMFMGVALFARSIS